MFEAFISTQADIYAFTETNVHWRNIEESDRFHERMRTWFQTLHQSVAYNITQKIDRWHQYGGLALFSVNKNGSTPLGSGKYYRRNMAQALIPTNSEQNLLTEFLPRDP